MDSELLDILVCPETKQKLTLVDQSEVALINERIRSGNLLNRAGERVVDEIDAALRREDGAYLYPVRHAIPVMLIEESFAA